MLIFCRHTLGSWLCIVLAAIKWVESFFEWAFLFVFSWKNEWLSLLEFLGDLGYMKIKSLLIFKCLQFYDLQIKHSKFTSPKIQVHICNQRKQKKFLRGDEINQNLEGTSHNWAKVRSLLDHGCAILISFKTVVIFYITSADFVLMSADVVLKMTTILKEMRIAHLCSKSERTLKQYM